MVLLFSVVVLRFKCDVAARQAGFHLKHFLALDVQDSRDGIHLALSECGAMGVTFGAILLQALFHGTQIEEQFALRLGRGNLDHAPVLQNVLMDLGLDPVHRITDEANILIRVETFHRLHQADVAFLDQIAVRQAVSQILAGDGNDEAQVRQHQFSGGLDVPVGAQAARGSRLFLLRQQGNAVDRGNVRVKVAQRGHQCPWIAHGQREGGRRGQVHGGRRHPGTPFGGHISTRGVGVLTAGKVPFEPDRAQSAMPSAPTRC